MAFSLKKLEQARHLSKKPGHFLPEKANKIRVHERVIIRYAKAYYVFALEMAFETPLEF